MNDPVQLFLSYRGVRHIRFSLFYGANSDNAELLACGTVQHVGKRNESLHAEFSVIGQRFAVMLDPCVDRWLTKWLLSPIRFRGSLRWKGNEVVVSAQYAGSPLICVGNSLNGIQCTLVNESLWHSVKAENVFEKVCFCDMKRNAYMAIDAGEEDMTLKELIMATLNFVFHSKIRIGTVLCDPTAFAISKRACLIAALVVWIFKISPRVFQMSSTSCP